MRGLFVSFVFLILSFNFVLADVEIFNYSFNNLTSSLDIVGGEVNISISDELYDSFITSNAGDEISLGDFLEGNGVDYFCNPGDCLPGYSTKGANIINSYFGLIANQKKPFGFVINGNPIEVRNVTFSVTSDFGESNIVPLSVDICGKKVWEFTKFSDIFREKDWGCYNLEGAYEIDPILIGSYKYCEEIYVPKTGKLEAGVMVAQQDSLNPELPFSPSSLTMSLNTPSGEISSCDFIPEIAPEGSGCNLSLPEGSDYFSAGRYDVCVSSTSGSTSDYLIYSETDDNNCGFVYGHVKGQIDFGIYARAVKYANSDYLISGFNLDNDKVTEICDDFLEERYGRNCDSDCIFPIVFSGINQDIYISNFNVEYTDPLLRSKSELYELNSTPATVSFDGVLDLEILRFRVPQSMLYIIDILGEEIRATFNVTVAPKIKDLTPLIVPAGVPVRFFVDVDFNGTTSLTYIWNFGDLNNATTYEPYVEHTYAQVYESGRNITVRVRAGSNLETSREFLVNVVSPKDAINGTLDLKRRSADAVALGIQKSPTWVRQKLMEMTGLSIISDKLNVIEQNYRVAIEDSDFIKIVQEIYSLDVPIELSVAEYNQPYLINNLKDVRIDPIIRASGISVGGVDSDYAKGVLAWQNNNIKSSFDKTLYRVGFFSGKKVEPITVYSFDVESLTFEDGYFVLDVPLSKLKFSRNYDAVNAGDYTVIPIRGEYDSLIEFYYTGDGDVGYFFSPVLTSIIVDSDIDTSCNYNLICEPELGENSENCRLDCMPNNKLIFFGLLIFFGFILTYTLLQIWYNKRYEKYLFPDGKELYNMLMFVANARTRGMIDGKISSSLKKKGWSGERVSFILKKSRGKRTGLPELIPISKISAKIRDSRARKQQDKQARVASQNQEGALPNPMGGPGLPPPINGPGGPYR